MWHIQRSAPFSPSQLVEAVSEVDLFDYELPEALVAARPTERREESRLLRLDRRTGEVRHGVFTDIEGLLKPEDLLVVNDARVIPARLSARRATGGSVEVLLVRPWQADERGAAEQATAGQAWLAMLRCGGKLRQGELVRLERPDASLELLQDRGGGYWLVSLATAGLTMEQVMEHGRMPLPPYVLKARRRRGMPEELPELDRARYQTVFAQRPGAVAAPTAGLHFTRELLARLQGQGVDVQPLSLLVGPGTFRPVKTARVEDHVLEPESYHLPAETAAAVAEALHEGRRIVATGTTCCRVLEYVARRGEWQGHSGWTDLFIHPPFEFKAVGALITNFHLPRSTLLMLVCAFAGRESIMEAYRAAIEEGYRFYSYGDAMFIC